MTYLDPFLQNPLILAFMAVNLAIGWWAHRKAKAGSFDDYATASRSLPTGVLIMTILATLISSMDLAVMDEVISLGILSPIMHFLTFAMSALFISFFVAPKLVFFDSPTFDGVMGTLYGKEAQLLAGIVHILFCLVSIVIQVATIGMLSKGLLDIPFATAVLFFGGMVVLYSTLGGMRAVSYTDVLQLVTVLIVLLWLTQKSVSEVGGVGPLFQEVSNKRPVTFSFYSNPDLRFLIKGWLYYNFLSFALVMSPPLVHRMLIVRDKSKVSRMWYTNIFIYGVIITMIIIVGMASILMLKSGEKDELVQCDIFSHMVKKIFENNPRFRDIISLGVIGILVSTMDSYLHTIGVTLVKGFIEPLKKLLGYERLNEQKQLNYARIGVFFVGLLTVLIGTKIEKGSARFIQRALFRPMIALQVIVTIPFILGVIGFKTDKKSFLTFGVTFLSTFYGQKLFFPWREELKHRADYDYFLIALPLGLLAYFITHIYINKGIAMITRGKNYTSEEVLKPSWQKIQEGIVQWIKASFDLPELSRKEISKRPSHALVFSVFMFALYGLGSGVGVSKDEGTINFMMLIYFIGISLCAGLMIEGIWVPRLKPYFSLYWLATVFFCLPLGGTLAFMGLHDGLFPSILFLLSFTLLSFLVSSRAFFWMSIWGLSLAWGGWYVVNGGFPENLWNEAYVGGYIGLAILMLYVLFFGHYFETYIAEQFYFKKVFGHTVTHEARQPLSEISLLSYMQEQVFGALPTIKNSAGESGYFLPKDTLHSIQDGRREISNAIQEINQDFMHFENLISKEIGQVPREKVYMKSLIDHTVLTFPKRYTSRIAVKVECKKDFQAIVIRPFFFNVLANFLVNAVKHGSASEMVIQIDGKEKKIRIRDNGRGIPSEVLPNIFNFRFTTGDNNNKGVGLAFVKLILDASNIKIEAHSKQGKESFTEFVLTFDQNT